VWVLKSVEGRPRRPLTFRITRGSIRTIGRAPRADFVVDAPLVSRLHCRLTAREQDDVLLIEDLKSTNGTYVNGKKIAKEELREGDQIGVGRVKFGVGKEDT
jgi:pSer/pThr/pTyr-binding forkhead associated (FHA) protein